MIVSTRYLKIEISIVLQISHLQRQLTNVLYEKSFNMIRLCYSFLLLVVVDFSSLFYNNLPLAWQINVSESCSWRWNWMHTQNTSTQWQQFKAINSIIAQTRTRSSRTNVFMLHNFHIVTFGAPCPLGHFVTVVLKMDFLLISLLLRTRVMHACNLV